MLAYETKTKTHYIFSSKHDELFTQAKVAEWRVIQQFDCSMEMEIMCKSVQIFPAPLGKTGVFDLCYGKTQFMLEQGRIWRAILRGSKKTQ